MIRRREQLLKRSWFEEWLDITFPEKLVTVAWCGLPYLIWLMVDGLVFWYYKLIVSTAVWVILSLLIYWFANFMASGDRHWN